MWILPLKLLKLDTCKDDLLRYKITKNKSTTRKFDLKIVVSVLDSALNVSGPKPCVVFRGSKFFSHVFPVLPGIFINGRQKFARELDEMLGGGRGGRGETRSGLASL